ncbi:MAG: D-alanyl-D-alanine carboxypeptidase/D-alanyl-D-alanine-endopeptidase [Ignavibacteriae bacterium]|nr:D-alanyl-D-alanine carboxypeptidase/D-alanyl-D-alanine-endopeptidase [Ignavibacteriota bacterium]NOG99348.1 D-alanyl-D-alanine carboxypeptidase/D-alanyl-D-alanine-endopeptidase [Ignavibacteriota bacterium]
MKKIIWLTFLVAAFTNINLTGQNKSGIQSIIDNAQSTKTLKHAQWSLYAKYVDDDAALLDYNSQFSLAPASGLKLFTTAAALYFLGEDFQFETELYYDGEIDEQGTLNGNIIIVGGGDPTLGSDRVAGSENMDELFTGWTEKIKQLGIKKIHGAIIADVSHFDRIPIPRSWIWEDIGNYYGAAASALSITENTYHLYFKPGNSVGDQTTVLRIEPEIPNLTFENYITTGAENSGDNGYIFNAPGNYDAVLRGTIPTGVSEFSIKGSIPEPPLFAALSFTDNLNANGIIVSQKPTVVSETIIYDDSKKIAVTKSPMLKDIIYHLNKRSINLYTEQILKEIGVKAFGEGSTAKGIEGIEKFLNEIGVNTEGFNLYDGSGLSRSNMITTKMMTEMLAKITGQQFYNSFYKSLGVAGDPTDLGFFKSWGRGTKIAGNARIKSGLINRVRSHSGYVNDSDGKLIAYSFIANNINGSHRTIDKLHRQILIELANIKQLD